MFITDIDNAVKEKLKGSILLPANKEGTLTKAVPVFVTPPERAFNSAVWPSVSWWQIGTEHDRIRETHQPENGIVCDLKDDPNKVNIRQIPMAFDEFFQLDIFSRFASHDREIQRQVWSILRPRGVIKVTAPDRDGNVVTNQLWMFLTDFRGLDDVQGKDRIYHKVLTWRILTALDVDPGIDVPKAYKGITLDVQPVGADDPNFNVG